MSVRALSGWLVAVFCGTAITTNAAPIVPSGFAVHQHAPVTDPINMALGLDGSLYVGRDNVGSGGDFGDAVKIHRVSAGGSDVAEYGTVAIPDPDAVTFDALGAVSGVPGSVLVGSGAGLFAIHPDQTVVQLLTTQQVGGEVNDMQFDSSGRLVMLVGDSVRVTTGNQPSPLIVFHNGWTPISLAIDSQDRIFLGGLSGSVDVYTHEGQLLESAFLTGLGWSPRIRFGRGGAFGTDLYIMSNEGDLFRASPDGAQALFASEFSSGTVMTAGSFIEFSPDGALYVGEFPQDRILRVAAIPEPPSFVLLLSGLGLIGVFVVRQRAKSGQGRPTLHGRVPCSA